MLGGAEDDVAAVVALELTLRTPEVRGSRMRLEELLDPEFSEIGASGRHWTRPEMIAALLAEDDVRRPAPVSELTARVVAPDLVLLTYRSDAPGRAARRSSLWRRTGSVWRVLFHQGTLT